LNATTTTIKVNLAIAIAHVDKRLPTSRGATDAINMVALSIIAAIGTFNVLAAPVDAVNVVAPSVAAIGTFNDLAAPIDAVNVVAASVIAVGAFH
jgi:hypothetical protein